MSCGESVLGSVELLLITGELLFIESELAPMERRDVLEGCSLIGVASVVERDGGVAGRGL